MSSNDNIYKSMLRIRLVEEEIARIYPSDKIKSPVHLSIGQEAVSVGVCEALRDDDAVFGTYRNHALYLAKGGDINTMMAELYGKDTGCNRGKGGSMHLTHPSSGLWASSAVVGTTIPIAVGFAHSFQYKKKDSVAVVFFGDGAVDEGAFHESMNFAALKKLPVLFVCENNFYAIHSHHLSRHPSDNICERARSYGIPAERIENNDVMKIAERTKALTEDMRQGKGPQFLECLTYRWKEHVGPGEDFAGGYRGELEAKPWIHKDQLDLIGKTLDSGKRREIDQQIKQEISDALEFAENSSFPAPEELFKDVFDEAL